MQGHLAELTRFAQADGLQDFCPRFNSYLNILYPEGKARGVEDEDAESRALAAEAPPPGVLTRYRLRDELASDYFTATEPSPSTVSTIDGLQTSHLCAHRLFFNVIVRQDSIDVAVSGDRLLGGGGEAIATELVSRFKFELGTVIEACA